MIPVCAGAGTRAVPRSCCASESGQHTTHRAVRGMSCWARVYVASRLLQCCLLKVLHLASGTFPRSHPSLIPACRCKPLPEEGRWRAHAAGDFARREVWLSVGPTGGNPNNSGAIDPPSQLIIAHGGAQGPSHVSGGVHLPTAADVPVPVDSDGGEADGGRCGRCGGLGLGFASVPIPVAVPTTVFPKHSPAGIVPEMSRQTIPTNSCREAPPLRSARQHTPTLPNTCYTSLVMTGPKIIVQDTAPRVAVTLYPPRAKGRLRPRLPGGPHSHVQQERWRRRRWRRER